MIIRHKNVQNEDFIILITYLSAQVGQNRLQMDDLGSYSFYAKAAEGEMITLVKEDVAYETGYSPFARLLTAKPSYDGEDCLVWAVEVEIPDHFHVGVINAADFDQMATVKRSSEGSHWSGPAVISTRFVTEISDILKGLTRDKMKEYEG